MRHNDDRRYNNLICQITEVGLIIAFINLDMNTTLPEKKKANQESRLGVHIDHTHLKKDDSLEINGLLMLTITELAIIKNKLRMQSGITYGDEMLIIQKYIYLPKLFIIYDIYIIHIKVIIK